jgi:SAM-dependent methyltransferase
MIELARHRLGDDVALYVADLAEPLPLAEDSSDDVVASLVLHYLEDWAGPLSELRRVLKPGGRLIVSVPHPFVWVYTHPDEDYFAIRQYVEDYEFAGEEVSLTHWHRPLHAMTDAFTSPEFDIAVVRAFDRTSEPFECFENLPVAVNVPRATVETHHSISTMRYIVRI